MQKSKSSGGSKKIGRSKRTTNSATSAFARGKITGEQYMRATNQRAKMEGSTTILEQKHNKSRKNWRY